MNPGPSRLQALLEVCLCSGFPTQFLIGNLLALAGVSVGKDGAPTLAFLVSLTSIDTVALVGLVLSLLTRTGESPRDVLLGDRPIGREVLRGLALVPWVFAIAIAAGIAILALAPKLMIPNPFASIAASRFQFVAFALTVILAAVREEIQRAFVLHRFEQRLGGTVVGVIVWGLVFGAGHYFVQGWSAAIVTALIGLLWNLVYVARRSVVAPMVSHASFNLIEVIGFGLAR